MKDRQPTKVLSNGAIRYGIYREDGTLDHYEYMKREDAPTVEGTPLNKANLLSDATAAKLWPNASVRPEDPTVNDALGKLAQGTAKVGDIAITARTDLSDAWLPCDGRTVSQEEYPSLCAVLRTPDSPSIWTEKTVTTNVGKGGDVISHQNGRWFRTYRDATSAHILVSDNGETWTEWAMPQDIWLDSTGISSRVVAGNAVKYLNGLYVCSVLVMVVTASGSSYYRGIIFADELFGQFKIDAPDWYAGAWMDYSSGTYNLDTFSDARNDVYWDGQRFFIIGLHDATLGGVAVTRYTNQLTNKTSPATTEAQSWTSGETYFGSSFSKIYIRETDGMIVTLVEIHSYGASTSISARIRYAKSAVAGSTLDTSEVTGYVSGSDSIAYGNFFEVNGNVYIYVKKNGTITLNKITGTDTLTVTPISETDFVDYAVNCNGQIVGVNGQKVFVAESVEKVEQGWDYTTTLTLAAENYPVAVGTVVRIPCSSANAAVKDIVHNFAYDNKKIPNITTDARSGAYIKALEE